MKSEKMKAVVLKEFGGPEVLKFEEIEKPRPKNDEVLVKIKATNVNFGDLIVRKFNSISPKQFNMPLIFWLMTKLLIGIRKPKINILGSEFSGIIESIGINVTNYKVGDEVFGYRSMKMGTNTEYITVPAKGLIIKKPKNISFEEAATFPYGSLTALNLLRKVNLSKGKNIVVIGASGSIGSFAVQLAKHYGAKVTGVCGTGRIEFVKKLGTDNVIDYTKQNLSELNDKYDVVFDILGRAKYSVCKNLLKNDGIYLFASFKMKQLLLMIWTKLFGTKKVVCALSTENYEDLIIIKELIENGVLKTIIDKTFPLEQTSEAHKYIENGMKKAQVVITMDH